jgi:hypothetical protein
MKIRKVIETPEGNFEFSGELNGAELDLVIEAGVNYLLKEGVLPFKASTSPEDRADYAPQEGSSTEQ